MIGKVLEHRLSSTELGTQHCPHKCLRRAVPLCQMPQTESNLLVPSCPLRSPRREFLSRLSLNIKLLRTTYTLLWDMESNRGYINIVAVMQKFFDQAISGNWSYNPTHYPNNEIPISVWAQDLLTTYKYGWKTSYYQNTYDNKNDEVEETKSLLKSLISQLENAEEEDCESCKI
jgi:ribonucleotide reductase alpha subunit